ncbi:hypothetical protein ZWY2020_007879 [Hordeum vulgare]|nr:hypothetical protein ZWY2020_007879 [Hordeum vulgare]
MALKKTPKGKSGFFGVRQKPFGNLGVEFSDAGRRWWIGTYPSAQEAARVYDVAVWVPRGLGSTSTFQRSRVGWKRRCLCRRASR